MSDKDEIGELIIFEEEVTSEIEDIILKSLNKKNNIKRNVKYPIIFSLIILSAFIIWMFIYQHNSSKNLLQILGDIFKKESPAIWVGVSTWMIMNFIIIFWSKIRIFKYQNLKIKKKHIFIASLLHSISVYITPFGIGGEVLGYLYLKKKHYNKRALMANSVIHIFLSQIFIFMQFIVLMVIGAPIYIDIFKRMDLWLKIIYAFELLILLILPVFFYSTIKSNRFQKWLIYKWVWFLERIPFKYIFDIDYKRGKLMGELAETKKYLVKPRIKLLVFELFIYSLIPLIFDPLLIIFSNNNFYEYGDRGSYINQIVAKHMVISTNAFSPNFGGLISNEFLTLKINSKIINNQIISEVSNKEFISALDLTRKIIYQFTSISLSIFTLIVIYLCKFLPKKKRNKNNI